MCAQTLSYLLYLIAYNEFWENVATNYWLAPMKVDWCLSWFNEEEKKQLEILPFLLVWRRKNDDALNNSNSALQIIKRYNNHIVFFQDIFLETKWRRSYLDKVGVVLWRGRKNVFQLFSLMGEKRKHLGNVNVWIGNYFTYFS